MLLAEEMRLGFEFIVFHTPFELLLMPDLEEFGLLVVHHVLVELLMGPQGHKVVDLRVESAFLALVRT